MGRRSRPLLCALCVLFLGSCSGSPGSSSSSEGLKIEETLITPEVIRTLAITAPEPPLAAGHDAKADTYRIGAGDVLRITLQIASDTGAGMQGLSENTAYVSGRDEYIVGPDGAIQYPFIGAFSIGGKTTFEAARSLSAELKAQKIYRDPFVNIRVVDFRSQTVNVTGEVKKPGALPIIETPYTVLSALQTTDGILETADLSGAVLTRSDGKRIPLNLNRLLKEGHAENNLTLLPGDTLHIPNNDANKILVFGEIAKPQVITMQTGSRHSIASALGEVGGWNPMSASMSHLYVLRSLPPVAREGGEAQPVVGIYRLDASSPEAFVLADQFTLRPRDVVYVSTRGITDWNRFVSQIVPTPFTYFLGNYSTYTQWRTTN